jgi:hypothetical protein
MKTNLKTALYLDDIRTPIEALPNHKMWDIVRNFDEFVNYITTKGIPDFISFDHDLHDEHMIDYLTQVERTGWCSPTYEIYKNPTGLHCAQWLVNYIETNNIKEFPTCSVHSYNPIGATNIQNFINSYRKHKQLPQNCFLANYKFTETNG